MDRKARIRLEYVVEVRDAGSGIPELHLADVEEVTRLLTPRCSLIPGTIRLSGSLTRESSLAARRASRSVELSKRKGFERGQPVEVWSRARERWEPAVYRQFWRKSGTHVVLMGRDGAGDSVELDALHVRVADQPAADPSAAPRDASSALIRRDP